MLKTGRYALVIASALIAILVGSLPAHGDEVRNRQWHLKFLDVANAHELSQGSGITVAVVDSGVDPHPDLRRNLLKGTDLMPGASGDGRKDYIGHGTAMAGLIAARGRSEDDGVLGIAPDARILPVRTQDRDATAGAPLAPGIEWAAKRGAQVINVSAATAPTAGLNRAISAAAEADAVVVASSGNRPQNLRMGYPAALDGVLAVGAVDRAGKHASFSVEGDEVQLCAPGVDMETTGRNGGYFKGIGTSNATAVVSGAAALVRAKFPELTAPQVIERLTSTATDIGSPGRDDQCGFGVLNIVKALTADVPGGENGDAGPSASASADEPPAADVAQPGEPDDGGNTLVLVASVGGGALVLGGLLAFLLVRRRGTT